MHLEDTADFIRQEINGCLDEIAQEIDNPAYLALLDKPFLRLTDEMVIEIVQRVNRHYKHPSIKHFELAYDALHYFLVRSTFFDTRFSAAYIQDNWAGCRRNHVGALNILRKLEILAPHTRRFSKVPQKKSMHMKKLRWLSLADDWEEKIRLLQRQGKQEPIRPYGFQRQVKAIYEVLNEEGRKVLLSKLPRDFGAKLRQGRKVQGSTQPMDCGLKILPYAMNSRNGIKIDKWLTYGAREV